MPNISCIIVTYQSEETIKDCLKSIENDLNDFTGEIILVDNASGDRTVSIARSAISDSIPLHIVANRNNLGFARGVNQGISCSQGEYILLLNPDTVIHRGFFDKMVSFLKTHPDSGIVAPKHLTPDGQTLPSCREFPNHLSVLFYMSGLSFIFPGNRIVNAWKMGYFDHNSARAVPQPMGACIMTRRSDVDTVGYMDERFWMFFNDVDWCTRFMQAGKSSFFLPEAVITHHRGHSIRKNKMRMVLSSHRAFALYFAKYYRGFRWILPNLLIYLSLFFSACLRILFHSFKIRK